MLNVSAVVFAAILSTSCAKETASPASDQISNIVITASIDQEKVSFSESGTTHALKGIWEVGDQILAMVDGADPISLEVSSVNPETGVATLSTTASLEDGDKVYGIYCPGAKLSDIKDGELPLDFSFQAADEVPALMVATATVESKSLSLAFSNCLSIIGIISPNINIKTDGRTMTRVIASGHEIVSSGKVVVKEGTAVFEPGQPDNFIAKSVVGIELVTVDDSHATFADPIYIAVPASKVEKITMLDSKSYIRAYVVNKTATAGKYARIYQKEFTMITTPTAALKVGNINWADKNLGAETAKTSSTNTWGDLYRWSDGGVIYTERTKTGVTFDVNHSEGYTSYSGEIYYDGKVYTKYTSADNKNVLDPVDDIVQLSYPGTGWRMPTVGDFNALNEYGNQNYGSSGWVKIGPNAELYIPRTYVSNKGTAFAAKGRYWTSSIDLTGNKPTFFEVGTAALTTGAQYRYYGFSIRPVKTSKAN